MNLRWLILGLIALSFPVAAIRADGTPAVRTEARLLGVQKPSYPREAQLRGIQGRVIIWVEVSAEGEVLEAKLHESSGYAILDNHTVRFAETLKFRPAYRGRTPVPATVLVPVRYRLVDPN